MTVPANRVYLYASTDNDYIKCLAAADVAGIPYSQCIGDYQEAWRICADPTNLLVDVGGAALYALYYNPCNWPNPAGQAGGHTPFVTYPDGHGVATVKANTFVNAGGYTALDSLTLAIMLSYYAIHGTFPHGYGGLPRQEIPQHVCVSGASPRLSVPNIQAPAPTPHPVTVNQPSVGVYASISTLAEAERALQLKWPGIGVTTALGTPQSPYTSVLPSHPDSLVAQALERVNSSAWWLSFWTVSWPSSGVTFHQAGYDAGQYAATQIDALPGTRRPDYVILDPEGYNQPAQTAQQFHDFVNGFAAGVTSINSTLKSGFYCNQSQYATYQLASVNLPAFVAIAPITGNHPMVSGHNITGYIAYYASCPSTSEINQVKSWGALYNAVQFRDSGVDCGPA
ncbi:hypothetical protein [Alicyclobacillus dauci]|uniref:Uncharacterized protein n=1 Tax=Alicyclobacillus dauci TaxID=1475485 RepID=A0ABY6Z0G5_9BACL|nr:hypothetical protein [Alicyclobacillus dauci]WAH35834.1 hypothetical protein NZD86_16390 [Alicyclobacillus dauci]